MEESGSYLTGATDGRLALRMQHRILGVSFAALLILQIGCSEQHEFVSAGASQNNNTTAAAYFPVAPGDSSIFAVTDASGADLGREIYVAGERAVIEALPGVRWTKRVERNDSTLIYGGHVFWDDNNVYHKSDDALLVERLISGPVVYGASWDRLLNSVVGDQGGGTSTGGSFGDNNTGGDNNGADGGQINGQVDDSTAESLEPQHSSFATDGSSRFYIAAVDTIISVNGVDRARCLEIVNAGDNQTVNHYWYSQGVGLVRYALNCQFGSFLGTVNGERIN